MKQPPSDLGSELTRSRIDGASLLSRREAIKRTAGAISAAALSQVPEKAAASNSSLESPTEQEHGVKDTPSLTVASCQFPGKGDVVRNAKWIRHFMHKAASNGAHLLHTYELCLSGAAGASDGDFPSFDNYDWNLLRGQTRELQELAKSLHLWLVLGSSHFLDQNTKPTNCLYLIDPQGQIVNRYDKCFPTQGETQYYSAGDRLVTHDIRGVKIGLAICNDSCYPQLYAAYREAGAEVMLHSFDNSGKELRNNLAVIQYREMPTRCADNRMWAVCNNSSVPYSQWGSFVARPDATITKPLQIDQPGMLMHHFPDGLSKDGWYLNLSPMKKRDDEVMHLGTVVPHPRRLNGQAEA